MFDKFNQKCGRCGGPVEEQMFHQIKLQKCLACGNVMMDGEDLDNLMQNDPSELPKVKPVKPKTIIPQAPVGAKPPTKSKPSSARAGLMSIASSTILPPEPSAPAPAPPMRKNRTLLGKTKPKTPPPPPPRANSIEIQNEPSLGFGMVDAEQSRSEPELGLPEFGKEETPSSPAFIGEEDTEEIERNFFTDDTTEFLTEESDAWTEEDERELASFASGQKRKGMGLWVAGISILAVIILIPTALLGLQYQQANVAPTTNTAQVPPSKTPVIPAPETGPAEQPKRDEPKAPTPPTEDPIAKAKPTLVKPPPPEEKSQPKVEPKPKAKPVKVAAKPKPQKPSGGRFIAEGWKLVESNPSKAAKAFRQALDLKQGDYEANYGYGYAMLKQGDPVEAKHYLCLASGSNNRETQREVLAVIARHGMSCN